MVARSSPRGTRSAGRALAWLLAGCLVLVLALLFTRRGFGGGVRVETLASPRADGTPADLVSADLERSAGPVEAARVAVPEPPAPPAATSRLRGRLQINGFAARRASVWLRSEDGQFERELGIDGGGLFQCEEVPAGRLLAGFRADGVFERELVLPDQLEILARAGETTIVDLDWWTRHVNVVVHSEDGLPGPARVTLRGPGYDTEFNVGENGQQRLELVGEGTFIFQVVTPAGRVGETELELEAGDDLDTAVLVARIKKY